MDTEHVHGHIALGDIMPQPLRIDADPDVTVTCWTDAHVTRCMLSHAYTGRVSDLSKHLPLSNQPRGDETGVTSDRRRVIGDLLGEASRLIASAPASEQGPLVTTFLDDARLAKEAPADRDPLARLAEAGAAVRSGRKRGIRPLVHSSRALFRLASALGVSPVIDPQIYGAIVLWGATSGPFDRRAVLSGHSIRATDSDWQFGRGPVLEGTALAIAAFVLGVSDTPPQPVSSPR